MSEIFRGYLELRFNIPALESSTYELKLFIQDLSINESWINMFLRNSDIVKFAKGIPLDKDSESFFIKVKSFIMKFGVLESNSDKQDGFKDSDDIRNENMSIK